MNKRHIFISFVILFLLGSCAQPAFIPTLTNEPTVALVNRQKSTNTSVPTNTPRPTETPPRVLSPTNTQILKHTPTPTNQAPTETPYDLSEEIDTNLNNLTESNSFSGSVLVARNGEVLLSKGYGLANRETNEANTADTKFHIASITKQFTSMAILMLQDQGKLQVNDLICIYITGCPSRWEKVTIHHLLTHTSGIPSYTDFTDYGRTKDLPITPPQLIGRLKGVPLLFTPGRAWIYSNSGYFILGYIIEVASAQTYDQFLQENIFVPLQMMDSGYDHNLNTIARGYAGSGSEWLDGDMIDMSVPYAAGALYSTVGDMYLWDQALYNEQLISQELLDAMFTPFEDTPFGGYGYGWIISERYNQRVIMHGGGIDGFVSIIERYPEDNVTIVILSNRETTDIGSITKEIARLIFKR